MWKLGVLCGDRYTNPMKSDCHTNDFVMKRVLKASCGHRHTSARFVLLESTVKLRVNCLHSDTNNFSV